MGSTIVGAQQVRSVRYHLSWPEPHTHYFHVQVDIERGHTGHIDVRMPAWRPGRYIIQNYARYVVAFQAYTKSGASLSFSKTDKNTWRIDAGNNQHIVIRYKAYANILDAGESYLDENEAYINPVSILMYVPGGEAAPSLLSFDKPAKWDVATALDYDTSKKGYLAEDYHELVDSPFIISPNFDRHAFDLDGATFELVFQGEGHYDPVVVLEDVKRIAQAQVDMMQVLPF